MRNDEEDRPGDGYGHSKFVYGGRYRRHSVVGDDKRKECNPGNIVGTWEMHPQDTFAAGRGATFFFSNKVIAGVVDSSNNTQALCCIAAAHWGSKEADVLRWPVL